MKVIVEGDLKELLTTGRNRKYREIERNVLLMNGLKRVVQIMMAAESPDELNSFSFLHYEKLKYGFRGWSSVRLSNSYVHRLLFEELDDPIGLKLIEIDKTHYGNKKG